MSLESIQFTQKSLRKAVKKAAKYKRSAVSKRAQGKLKKAALAEDYAEQWEVVAAGARLALAAFKKVADRDKKASTKK